MTLSSTLDTFTLAPKLVWGLWPRWLAGVYLIAFFSMRRDVLAMAGSRGITPHARTLEAMERDFPGLRRFFYFPSLLWLTSSDRALRGFLTLGMLAAASVLVGGPHTPFALALCWLVLLSYDAALDLAYPWESMLLEAGFLAVFLAPIAPLPSVDAAALPSPALAFAHRFLLFRVLFGFGKFRFLSGGRWDWAYLRSFLVGQPIPTKLGWRATHASSGVLRLALLLMFLVEIPLPFFVFARGAPRVIAALGFAGLMAAIELSGNFGFFNLLVLGMSVTLLDTQSTVFALTRAQVEAQPITHAILAVLFVGALLHLPFSTWVSRSWLYWPVLERRVIPLPLRWLLRLYRALMPFRVVQAYGVFPPYVGPPSRWATLLQGSRDGVHWESYRFRYTPTQASSAPSVVAPLCPRLDHMLFYEALGVSSNGLYGSFFGLGVPYRYARWSPIERLMQRLLEGDSHAHAMLAHNPFPDPREPPTHVRVRLLMLERTGLDAQRETGAFWRVHDAGVHLPPTQKIEGFWQDTVPAPELFHWDERGWQHRAVGLEPLRRATRERWRAALRTRGLTDDEIDTFWGDLIPMLQGPVRHDWAHFEETLAKVERRFSAARLRRLERVALASTYAVGAKLEPFYEGVLVPKIRVASWFHLGLFVNTIVLDGLPSFEAALARPEEAAARDPAVSLANGLLLWGVFRPEMMRVHGRKARLLKVTLGTEGQPPMPPGIPGFVREAPWFESQLMGDDERLPTWRRRDDGEWERVA